MTSEEERADAARDRARDYEHLLLVSDRDYPRPPKQQQWKRVRLQGYLNNELRKRTLSGQAYWLVIEPELEIWLWQDCQAIAACFGVDVKIIQSQMAQLNRQTQPKDALERLVQFVRHANGVSLRLDAELKGRIAEQADLQLLRRDPAFQNLQKMLRKWFR